ncbi:MAG: hypothetical protein HFH84_06260 [Lachnospiraceae bacterium]|nr:hypothetical protein [Lachnospiraceae bacterium]
MLLQEEAAGAISAQPFTLLPGGAGSRRVPSEVSRMRRNMKGKGSRPGIWRICRQVSGIGKREQEKETGKTWKF